MEKHGESHAFFIPAAGYWLHAHLPDIYGMNTSTDAAAPIAVFNSRAFRWPFWLCIILMMQAGMGAMFIPILLGAPVWVSVAVLMGVILLMMGLLAGNCTYTLHDGGITQEIRSFSLMPVLKRTVRHFSWSQILYYKAGTDMTKSLEQYNYLYISVSPFPYQLRLSDHQWDKQAFLQFAEAFATQIEIRKQQTPSSSKPSTAACVHFRYNAAIIFSPEVFLRKADSPHFILDTDHWQCGTGLVDVGLWSGTTASLVPVWCHYCARPKLYGLPVISEKIIIDDRHNSTVW
ncbi:hypothetical protein [Phnomibacter ginsenosidimutans]|uniref:Uncharacterized protein n=1 Tax=Phnomibacter ginsenosidimutans TaxID=2676868 RepID=A0A6I6G6T5_9BACT|nr:hypothetical protein [Phnomibacter ginsenosidimutans]QGW27834.1 hypothetical protein GLV81_06755 [Phnomibacter ginsenosidimutans]